MDGDCSNPVETGIFGPKRVPPLPHGFPFGFALNRFSPGGEHLYHGNPGSNGPTSTNGLDLKTKKARHRYVSVPTGSQPHMEVIDICIHGGG